MKIDQAAVLLSGGLDSTAAICWAAKSYERLLAVMFDGQPNRDQELTCAQRIVEKLSANGANVTGLLICIADSLPRGRGILVRVLDHDGREDGVSPAFVTGRNPLFLVSAAAHACEFFPNGNLALIIAVNAQDARRFPDCHPSGLPKLAEALRVMLAREITIVAPFVDWTKTQLLRSLDAGSLEAVASSWSCYRGDGPCGKCSACVLRAEAFAAVGIVDRCERVSMTGGDPSRCR